MFGTRKLEKFDLHGLRKPASGDEQPVESFGFESGERPTMPFNPLADLDGELVHRDVDPATPRVTLPAEDETVPVVACEAPPSSATHAIHQAPTPFVAWVPTPIEGAPVVEAPAPAEVASTPAEAAPPTADALRTRLTRKFVSLAETVSESFRDVVLGGDTYVVELTAPTGMSTAGGKQALQHLRLVPRRENGTAILAGTVNQVEQRAELRDFDHIAVLHSVRFNRPLDFDRAAWELFLVQAEAVLSGAGVRSLRTAPPSALVEERRRSMQPRISKPAIYALIVALALAAIMASRVVIVLLRH